MWISSVNIDFILLVCIYMAPREKKIMRLFDFWSHALKVKLIQDPERPPRPVSTWGAAHNIRLEFLTFFSILLSPERSLREEISSKWSVAMPVTWSLSIRDPILFGHNSLPQVWKKWLRRDPARVGAGRNTVPKHDSWENSLKWTGEASESKVRGQWKAMRVMSERSQNNYFWGGSHRESKALLPLQNGQLWTGASSRFPHLHCKRQIASTASL